MTHPEGLGVNNNLIMCDLTFHRMNCSGIKVGVTCVSVSRVAPACPITCVSHHSSPHYRVLFACHLPPRELGSMIIGHRPTCI
jgi:hypothetical protein